MKTETVQSETSTPQLPKKWFQSISDYFLRFARKIFFKLGKKFVIPDREGQGQLPHIKITHSLLESLNYKEKNAFYQEQVPKLIQEIDRLRTALEKSENRIYFLDHQIDKSGLAFKNLKLNIQEKERLIQEKEVEIDLLSLVIANHFIEKALIPPVSPPKAIEETPSKRERLMLKAKQYDLPKIAEGFGNRKTVFLNTFLEELFENKLSEKVMNKIIASLKDLCQNGPDFRCSFQPHPLNGRIKNVPRNARIIDITKKYRLIYKEMKADDTVVFYHIRRRNDGTYR